MSTSGRQATILAIAVAVAVAVDYQYIKRGNTLINIFIKITYSLKYR